MLINAEGKLIPVFKTVAPATIAGRKYLVEGFIDVSEQKRVAKELTMSEDQYKNLAESISDVFFAMNNELRCTYWNKASEALTGIPAKDAVGKYLHELFPDTRGSDAEKLYQEVLKTRKPGSVDNKYGMGGKPHFFEISAYPAQNGVSVFVKDITERKRMEEELRQHKDHLEDLVKERTVKITEMNKQLELANKALESFSYSVSHDLRAPLRSIDGFSRTLLEDHSEKLDAESKRLLDTIRRNTDKMKQLIEGLLSLSRLERQKMKKSEIKMDALAKDEFKVIRDRAPGRQIELKVGKLPPAHGDTAMICDVFANILDNAVKFTRPRRKAVIEVGGRVEGNENVYYVKDNGVGFDMRYADRIFGAFQRLHKVEDFKGTGIGLATVRRVIHRHGGRVWAEGEVGKGATFYFTLPIIDEYFSFHRVNSSPHPRQNSRLETREESHEK
jgi:PAS domain S-box-containing protein